MRKILLFFCFFSIVFKPEYIFIPHSNNTFFGLLGLILYTTKGNKWMDNYHLYLKPKLLISQYYPVLIFAILTLIINFSTDIYYVKYIIVNYLAYWSWYFVAYLFYEEYNRLDINILIKYFVLSALLQVILSLLMFTNPNFQDFLLSFLKQDEISLDAIQRTQGGRLLTFGSQFYTAGLINGLILILIALTISNNDFTYKKRLFYIFSFFIITIFGMMMARTTLIGCIAGMLILMHSWIKSFKAFVLSLLSFLLIIFLFGYVASKYFDNSAIDFVALSKFAFDMFEEGGGSQFEHSMESMWSMYKFPNDFKTWIIGDARWMNDSGTGYYMNVDIGYLRALYYLGIFGLIALFVYYYRTIKIIFFNNRVFDKTPILSILALLGYVLVLNLKGPADIIYYILPYYFISNSKVTKQTC